MFATLITVTLFAAAAVNAQQLSIATPDSVTACQPVDLSWSGGLAPYNLIMTAPGQCDAIVDLGDQSGTTVNWTPKVAPGTQLQASLIDSNGDEAWSGTMTVQGGSDTSCLDNSSNNSSSSSASAGTTAVASTTLKVAATPSSSASSTPTNAGPLGAVGNNGPIKSDSNGAMAHAAAPVMILSAVAGILAFSL